MYYITWKQIVISNLNFYLDIVFHTLRGSLEPSEKSSAIGVRAMDEDHLEVSKVLQEFHPDISLVWVWRDSPQEWYMDILEKANTGVV